MASDSYQLLGMAERGLLPKVFCRRSKHGTPTCAIIVGSVFCMIFAVFDFAELVEMVNFLYIFAQLIEFAAFVKLRHSAPRVHRPFKIPLGTFGCCVMLTPPVLLMCLLICLATLKTWLVCLFMACLGVAFNCLVDVSRRHKWLSFNSMVDPEDLDGFSGGLSRERDTEGTDLLSAVDEIIT